MQGYIKLDRGILQHPAFQKRGQEYCEIGAFVWMIFNASFVDRDYLIYDKKIHLKRGQLCSSQTFMAEAWGWSKSKVQRYLDNLKKFDVITVGSPSGSPSDAPDIITIANYNEYQDTPNFSGSPSEPPSGHKHNKLNNKGNNNIVSEVEKAGEEWWKSFRFFGNNKGRKDKVIAFYKKNFKDKELLKKVLDTYNHYADSQKERNLSAPMVSTWLNGKNWEEYSTTTTKNDFPIVKDNTVRLKNLSDWVTADPPKRVTSVISDDDVKEMLENKIIEQHHFYRWMNG